MSPREPVRMTRQRRVILEELNKVQSHPTADEVYARVRRRLPHVSLGTVYRNLDVLSHGGVIQKLEPGGVPRRFDGNRKEHHHVRCLACGRIDDVCRMSLGGLMRRVRERCSYEVMGCRLEFVGLCPRCRARGKHPRRTEATSGGRRI